MMWNWPYWFQRYEWRILLVCGLLCLFWPLPARPALERLSPGVASCGAPVAALLMTSLNQTAWRFELARNCHAAQRTFEQMRWFCPELTGVAHRAQELEHSCQSIRRP